MELLSADSRLVPMKFIDSTEITVCSGNGGDGLMSFKRLVIDLSSVLDGGNGGNGGDVVICAG